MKKMTVHVLSHTHWDREWYQPFQGYRKRLVYQVERLLDLLESRPAYRHFHLDGQTAPLLDYLEIRPEDRPRLARLIRAGRLLVGPWFVMPDELLVSGEGLVRNLLAGRRIARAFGGRPMPCGYVVDTFGHASQLPQVLAGFGIGAAMLHRGTSGWREQGEMAWVGADGTRALLIKVFLWSGYNDFWTLANGRMALAEYERRKAALATAPVLHALDGCDHAPAAPNLPDVIRDLNRRSQRLKFIHSSFPKYLAALRLALGPRWWNGRKELRGELRTPARRGLYNQTFNGTASARPYLKQWNDRLEMLLAHWAEPFDGFARAAGADDQQAFLDLAWRYLLLNHPHDSIVGCSADDVHRDMLYRFRQAYHLARDAATESLVSLAEGVNSAALPRGDRALIAFQAASGGGAVALVDVDVPSKDAEAYRRQGLVPHVYDAGGRSVPVQVVEVCPKAPPEFLMRKIRGPAPIYATWGGGSGTPPPVDGYRLALGAALPPYGYRAFGLVFERPEAPPQSDLKVGPRSMENAILKVTVRADGRFDVADKATGRRYAALGLFEDVEDAGNGWNFMPAGAARTPGDPFNFALGRAPPPALSGGRRARVRVLEKGPLLARMRIDLVMRVPDHSPGARPGRRAALRIATTLTLTAGSPLLRFQTTVQNTVSRHRLRVLFPTGLRAKTYFVDAPYDVLARPIAVPDTRGWNEQAFEHRPMKSLLAVHDGRAGLALVTAGLCEGCVQDTPDRRIALTLFRSFIHTLAGRRTEDSRLLGTVEAEYGLMPFRPDPGWEAALLERAIHFRTGARAALFPKRDGPLPPEQSFLQVRGPLVVQAFKAAEHEAGRRILRLLNPLGRAARGTVRLAGGIREAWECNLAEERVRRVRPSRGGDLALRLRPKQVLTLML